MDCHYCGRPPAKSSRQKYPINGIDRVDNKKGYTEDNIVPCCRVCNRVKSNIFNEKQMLLIGKVLRIIRELD